MMAPMEPDRQHPNSAAPARKNSTYRIAFAVTPPAALQAADGGSRPMTVPTVMARFPAEYRPSSPKAPHNATPSSCSGRRGGPGRARTAASATAAPASLSTRTSTLMIARPDA